MLPRCSEVTHAIWNAGDGDMGPADDDSEHGEAPDMASLELAATWTGSQWPAEAPGGPASDAMLALDSQVPSYEDLCRAHIEVTPPPSSCCCWFASNRRVAGRP